MGQFLVYFFFFVIPMTLQMFTLDNEIGIIICISLCLISQTVIFITEIIKMRALGKEYFLEFYHYIEIAHVGLFVFYFFLRVGFLKSMLPEEYVMKYKDKNGNVHHSIDVPKMDLDDVTYFKMMYFSIFNCFLYAMVGLKLMSYMRMQPKLG